VGFVVMVIFRKIQKLVLKTILRDHSIKRPDFCRNAISTKPASLNVFTSLQPRQMIEFALKQYRKKII